jgi:hypothetical protein
MATARTFQPIRPGRTHGSLASPTDGVVLWRHQRSQTNVTSDGQAPL